MQIHHESKPHHACKGGLLEIKVMKVQRGWKWSLIPPSGVLLGGGRLIWSRSFDHQLIKLKPFTEAEEDLIIKLHSLLGNRWALIAARLPDRTENEVKTYWNSKLNPKLSKNSNMRTSNKKKKMSFRLSQTRDQPQVSDAAGGLDKDSTMSQGLNLDLSMSMSSSSPLWDVKEKVEANSSDHSPNIDTGNTGNKTLLLFQ